MATRQLAGARTGQPKTGRAAKARPKAGPAADQPAEPAAEGKVLAPGELPDIDDDDIGDDDIGDDFDEQEERRPVPRELVFTTPAAPPPAADADEDDAEVAIEVDGVQLIATRPADEAFVYLSRAASRLRKMHDKAADILDFLDQVFDEEAAIYLRERAVDPADPFKLDHLGSIMEGLVKYWSGGKKPRPVRSRPGGRNRRR